jgi:hypothetical protein
MNVTIKGKVVCGSFMFSFMHLLSLNFCIMKQDLLCEGEMIFMFMNLLDFYMLLQQKSDWLWNYS